MALIIGSGEMLDGGRAQVSVDGDAGPPAAALAKRLPEVAAGDIYRQARGGGSSGRLLALPGGRAETVAAIPAMALGDEGLCQWESAPVIARVSYVWLGTCTVCFPPASDTMNAAK